MLLQSRDAKVLNNALSSINSIYSGLDNTQGYLFSKYKLLPLLVLLREAQAAKIRAAAAPVTRPQPALPAPDGETGDSWAAVVAVRKDPSLLIEMQAPIETRSAGSISQAP